ncbi:DUF305 domain-containing protein [Herbiconiux sp. P15]|uniref:DUF305 domain-containing protein n=1 Tax=Herbiconiux liukaitaii TaxID=3342799 RepID=UPI0035BAF753
MTTGAEQGGSAPRSSGDPTAPSDPAVTVKSAGRGRVVLAAVVAVAVLVVAAFSAGWLAAPRVPTPTDTSVEAGFARDMQTHHNQAVEMSLILRDVTDDPEVRSLAYDIATSQSQQSGQMYAWLNSWGLPQASSQPVMSWMSQPTLDGSDSGHGHGADALTGTGDAASTGTAATAEPMTPGGEMPGMATFEQLQELQQLQGVDAERLYLELMIAHHRGGVEMAEAAVSRTTNPLVVTLADAIIVAQQSEIEYMQTLLAART